MKKRILILTLVFVSTGFVLPTVSYAHCPLCTIGIGILGAAAQAMGVSLGVIGLFVGAFVVSTGMWISMRINWRFKYKTQFVVLVSFVLTVLPLRQFSNQYFYIPVYWLGEPGSILNRIYFIDQFIAGSVLGWIMTVLSMYLNSAVKRWRGRVLFPFQGVMITLLVLVLAGVILQLLS